MIEKANTILKNVFGYTQFRYLQEKIIGNVLDKRDTLAVMPTGSGKSLCYQIPALLAEGLTLVISPLISLMKDQVEQLRELAVPAVYLNSSLSWEEYQTNIQALVQQKIKLLYLAPETLLKPDILALLSRLTVNLITIDEAHCISHWGHDFRPEYRQLIRLRKQFPDAVILAVTATATPRVQEDIKKCLGMAECNQYISSFNRENLFLDIKPKSKPLEQTLAFLEQFPEQSGIIYCLSRRQVDQLTEELNARGLPAKPYHAGLTDQLRMHNQDLFIKDKVRIMVATIAFGMGINKPDVRFILHYDLPQNIESYYQQIGRAGRDGLPAHCLMLFGYQDVQKVNYLIQQKENEDEQRIARIHLNDLLRLIESGDCRRSSLLRHFGEVYTEPGCSMCDNCTTDKAITEHQDISREVRQFLSCAVQTNQVFGASYLIDILRGAEIKRIQDNNHQHLALYGAGKEHSKKEWLQLSRQIIQKGFLTQDLEYGSLKLTRKGNEVLKNNQQIMGRLAEEAPAQKADKAAAEEEVDYDTTLYGLLKKQREVLAREQEVPPYVVFHDRSLMEFAAYYPQSEESLLQMHGVGMAKAEKYGTQFLDVIRDYCKINRLAEKKRPARQGKATDRKSAATTSAATTNRANTNANKEPRKYELLGTDYELGLSIEQLMEKYEIKKQTVIDNLYRYLTENHSLRTDEFISLLQFDTEMQDLVNQAFVQCGTERLKPVFEKLKEKVDYDRLHIARLYYLSQGGKKKENT